MAKAKGTVYLHTDHADRDISRAVERDLRVTYYPGSESGDRPIIVRMAYRDGQLIKDTIVVSVYQVEEDGTEITLWEGRTPNAKPS